MIKNKDKHLGLLAVLVISGFVFYCTFLFQVWQTSKLHIISDVPFHTEFILKFAREHDFPAYSLWYKLVYVFSGLSDNYNILAITSVILLTLLVSAKYLINHHILSDGNSNKRLVALISFAVIFVMPVISYYSCKSIRTSTSICFNNVHVYLGNIAPNQWHNSTLILAMPLNLLLFYFSVKNIQSERTYSFVIMGLLSVLSILCKPNYALAFLPVISVAILILNIKAQQYWRAIFMTSLVAVPSILALSYQWYFTFIQNNLLESGAKTVIAPFFVWSNYSPHIALSLLLSIAFPLLVLLFYFKKIDLYLKFSWVIFLVSLSITATFAEYPNWGAGNFFWGSIAANYILFLFSAKLLLKQAIDWRSKLSYRVFGLHFLTGLLLLAGFFIGQKSLML